MARPDTPPPMRAQSAQAARPVPAVLPTVMPALVTTTAQRAFKVLQSSSAPAQRSLFLRPLRAG